MIKGVLKTLKNDTLFVIKHIMIQVYALVWVVVWDQPFYVAMASNLFEQLNEGFYFMFLE